MSEGLRILYIDDDPGLSRLVQRALGRLGCEVVLAANGEDGLRTAAQGGFDAVALDNYMPGRSGLELLPELLALPGSAPVVFVTAGEEPRIAVAALKQGASDYVVKDVAGEFVELLHGAVLQSRERRELLRQKEEAERAARESHDRLERLARQQAVLLREVNHRVANSLQLITSLMEMQARRLPETAAREVLRRAAERVGAVMLVHRWLYSSSEVGIVELDTYLAGLLDELGRALHGDEGGARIALRAEPVRVDTDKAVPLGLIVNEWVTNAVKYAYAPGKGGEIRVHLLRCGGEEFELAVEDDGPGMPLDALSAPRGSGLGGMIVSSMASTIAADISLDSSHRGTRCVLRARP